MRNHLVGSSLLAFISAAPAGAQDAPPEPAAGSLMGAPATGIEVPSRFESPSDSQSILSATPPESAPPAGPPPPEGAPGEEDPVRLSERVSGFSQADAPADQAWLDGATIYTGIVPLVTDTLPHLSRQQARGEAGTENTLVWIGYQPFPGVSRVFVQTGRAAQYQVRESPDGLTVTLRLRNTRVDFSNLRRAVDARYFGRVVRSVDATRAGDGAAEIVIELGAPTGRRVAAEGDYLFLDFAELQ